jgi:WD40 repeat protein
MKAFNSILESPGDDSLSLSIAGKYNIDFEPAPVEIQYADLSQDSKYIFGYGDSLIIIWNLLGKLESIITTEHTPIIDIKLSYDDQFIGAVSRDSILTIWNKNGTRQFSKRITYNNVNTKQVFSFTSENNVISLFDSCDAVLFNQEGRILQSFNRHSGRVNGVDISPNNNFIATASSDKTINIWYFNTIKKRYDYYNSLTWHSDTVWSASFSGNSLNIITTSSDFDCRIGNINNETDFWRGLSYTEKNSQNYLNLRSCYAEIANTGNGIVMLSYSYDKKNLDHYYYGYDRYNPNWDISNREGSMEQSRFSSLVFSYCGEYYACNEKDKVYLVDNRSGIERNRLNIKSTYTLMEFRGRNPIFTADSRYLIFTNKEKIQAIFIDISFISKVSSNLPE